MHSLLWDLLCRSGDGYFPTAPELGWTSYILGTESSGTNLDRFLDTVELQYKGHALGVLNKVWRYGVIKTVRSSVVCIISGI